MKLGKSVFAAAVAVVALSFAVQASASSILVAGPSPTAPFGGTVINFEGLADGTIVSNQYAGLGVTFGQDDGGTPQIDAVPMLFGYGPGSGTNVLTGSTNGGAAFPTIAGLIADFSAPVSQAGAFLSDTAPLGDYLVQAFGVGNVFLESVTVTAAMLTASGCGEVFPSTTGCGVFVGFSRGSADIARIQFGPSGSANDAFAIDDVRFSTPVPEPASLLLLGSGLLGTRLFRKRRR
jgi:hypothetical protein